MSFDLHWNHEFFRLNLGCEPRPGDFTGRLVRLSRSHMMAKRGLETALWDVLIQCWCQMILITSCYFVCARVVVLECTASPLEIYARLLALAVTTNAMRPSPRHRNLTI